jgi:hypothetical protein
LGWFRRKNGIVRAYNNQYLPGAVPVFATNPQTALPYTYVDQPFQPVKNPTNAQLSDTLDDTIGIVNEYSLDSSSVTANSDVVHFGRYEVRKVSPLEPTTTPIATRAPNVVRDVSGNRLGNQVNGNGLSWSVVSTGYVYKRLDKTISATPGVGWIVPYNQPPNKVLATAKVATELRKLTVNLPSAAGTTWYAGIYCTNANARVTLPTNNLGILNGAVSTTTYATASMSSAAVPCPKPINNNTTNCPGGCPSACVNNAGALADTSVFAGLTIDDLKYMADYRGDSTTPLDIKSDWKLSFFQGNLTYQGTLAPPYDRLHTNGILIVNGDLTLNAGNMSVSPPILASSFGGIVFVTGDLIVRDGSSIDGCVIMGSPAPTGYAGTPGDVTVAGTGGNIGIITVNPALITLALNMVAQYRENIATRKLLLAVPGLQ